MLVEGYSADREYRQAMRGPLLRAVIAMFEAIRQTDLDRRHMDKLALWTWGPDEWECTCGRCEMRRGTLGIAPNARPSSIPVAWALICMADAIRLSRAGRP